jgi:hypothetical protein
LIDWTCVSGTGRQLVFEVQQVTQLDRARVFQRVGKLAVHRIIACVTGGLQRVDQRAVQGVRLVLCAQAVEPADRQRDHILIERHFVAHQRVLFQARQAEARDAAVHAGEIVGHKRAGEAERLEIVAAAIGRDDRDAHLGHDLQQARLNGGLVVCTHSPSDMSP